MPTDYYDDSTESESTPAKKTKSEEGSATALLPLSFFPDKPEVGKVCKIRQEKVFSDQVEVSYVAHDSKESETESEDETASEAPSDMEEMMA